MDGWFDLCYFLCTCYWDLDLLSSYRDWIMSNESNKKTSIFEFHKKKTNYSNNK